jgi:act minimal PKS acyl carrier protein
MQKFTLDDLLTIMRACAGEAESIDLDSDVLDMSFDELGYDSIALLETASRIQRSTGITIADVDLSVGGTPRALVELVNSGVRGRSTT